MSFLDSLMKNVSDAADYTVRKTGELTEIAKLRMEIHNCNNHITQCYEHLGRLYYKSVKNPDGTGSSSMEKYVAEADQWKEKLSALRVSLARAQGSVICDACGAQISVQSVYCPLCGVKLPTEEADDTASDVACTCVMETAEEEIPQTEAQTEAASDDSATDEE